MRKLFLRFWPVIFIFTLWFIFASPYFVKGLVPYASKYQVNFFAPWSHYERFWGPVKNNAMPDVHTQIYPWKKFTIDTYKIGQIPLWNPYNFAGNPHLANFQSAVLSPFNLLFLVFSFIDAWSILVLLQPLLAGLFMYLFVREIGVSRIGSVISSIAFMFCGFMVVWMAYGTLSMSIAFLPLVLFGIERSFNKMSLLSIASISLGLALSFFSGHFQTSLYLLMFILAFFIFKSISIKNLRTTFLVLLAISLGMALSLFQITPSIKLYLNSVRSEIFIREEGIPFYYLVNTFSPDFFGNPVTRNDWFGFYAEWASFIGIVPLILSIIAIVQRKNVISIFFIMTGMTALILAVDSPIQILIGSLKIPVLSTSNPSRIIVLFSFSLAVLAGFGFDKLAEEIKERKRIKKIILPFVAMTIFIAFIWFIILFTKIYPDEWLIVAKRNLILPTLLFITGAAAIILSWKFKKFTLFAIYYLLFTISFDSVRFATKWMPFDPKDLVYPNVSVVDVMKRESKGIERVFGNIEAVVSSYYGIQTIEGYDPLYIGRYGDFIRGASTGEFLQGERSVVKLDRIGKYTNRVLDLLGVSLVFHPIADTNAGWAYPAWADIDRFSLVYQDDKFQLFKNKLALPRAVLFYDYEVIKDNEQVIKRFYSDDFDFKKKLILEEDPILNSKEGTGEAKIVKYTPDYIEINVETSKSGLLFLSDNYYVGWKAKINPSTGSGQVETKIYRADYTFRAVVVPKGVSKVEFIYENWNF